MVSRVFRSPHLLGFTRFERAIPADAPMMRRLSNLTQTYMAGQSRTESITAPRSGAHPLGAYRPVCPSICSRRMSAWPACLAVSSTMCTRSHRSDNGSGVVSGLAQS